MLRYIDPCPVGKQSYPDTVAKTALATSVVHSAQRHGTLSWSFHTLVSGWCPFGISSVIRVPGYRDRSRVRFPAPPDFLSSSGSGTGSTRPREDK
jgi:hypothetical protein